MRSTYYRVYFLNRRFLTTKSALLAVWAAALPFTHIEFSC